MSKKDEKIIISKQLALDLIWWLEHASAPCMTIGEVQERWYQLFSDPQLTLARDSMKAELEKALVAKIEVTYEPVDHVTNVGKKVVLTVEEAKLVKKALAIASCPCFADCDTYFAFFKEMGKRIEQAEKNDATE